MSEPCPACLEGHCPLHEHGKDPNTFDLSATFGPSPSMDLRKSVRIWQQQAADEATERERAAQEREEAEAEYHKARAEWLANGGRL